MALRVERIPTLRDNYTYLLVCEKTGEAAVVDAPEAAPVERRARKLGVRVAKVLSTHHHPDHSAANPELAKRYDAPVYGHVSDAKRIPGFTHGLEEGDEITVGEERARILFIPAHTRGHIAYVFDGAVFCGDTLFAAGCGRLFEGTPAMMYAALALKLGRLPGATRVYCGHEYTAGNLRFAAHVEPGNEAVKRALALVAERRARAAADWHDATPDEMTVPTTIADEHATNPFLRAGSVEELGRRRAAKDAF
jgi:hydroxyacylglutathione hydrolase